MWRNFLKNRFNFSGLLSDTILDPIYDDFKDFKNLYISPDSDINLGPFTALKSPNRIHIMKFIIRLITTGRELYKGNLISQIWKYSSCKPYFGENNIQNFKIKRSNKNFL